MSIADIQKRARQGLHDTMKRPAALYDKSGVLVGLIHVRRKTDVKPVGDLAGTNLSYAEVVEPVSSLIFLLAEHAPARGEMVIMSTTEGYFVDTIEPPDGITQTAKVSRMSETELAGKVVPDDISDYQIPQPERWVEESW